MNVSSGTEISSGMEFILSQWKQTHDNRDNNINANTFYQKYILLVHRVKN